MVCLPDIRPQNATRRFSQPAKLVRAIVARGLLHPNSTVLEVGAGCLRNAFYLLAQGHHVTVVERDEVRHRFRQEYSDFQTKHGTVVSAIPRGTFDLVLATFVLETICPLDKRHALLGDMVRATRKGGVLALALRGVSDVKTAKARGEPYLDGYVTPARTFVKPYTVSEIRSILLSFGLSKVDALARVDAPQIVNVIAVKGIG